MFYVTNKHTYLIKKFKKNLLLKNRLITRVINYLLKKIE